MDTPRRSYWQTAPQSALRNISNGQSASIRGLSLFDQHKIPEKKYRDILTASAKRIHLSLGRESSQAHGDLSNLRPRSPPIQNFLTGMQGHHLRLNQYADDVQNFSPSYNRQARLAIPNDWMTSTSFRHPPTATDRFGPTGQPICHSALHDRKDPHRREAEPTRVSIQGLTSEYIQPLDFSVPVTRSHPGDEDQHHDALYGHTGRNLAIEHVDISTVWNGLSNVDANELLRVHRTFVSTLEKMLAKELWRIYQQLQQQDSAGNIKPIHTLFSAGIVRGISFCRDQLVSEMAAALYPTKENAGKAKSGFLRLYLIATDVLKQHEGDPSRDTSITIRMRCDPSSLRLSPLVDAAWVPDSLMIDSLDEYPLEGQKFSIIPRYFSKSAFRLTRFPKNVKYSIESEPWHPPLSWLIWDDKIAGFEGVVPFYSEANNYDKQVTNTSRDSREAVFHLLKITVQAVLVDDNASSVRYKRIVRVRLTIKVVPWYMNSTSREVREPFSVPKAYLNTSHAPTAHRFAVQGRVGSHLYPRRSSSRLSQRTDEDHLHTPIENAHTGLVGSRHNHSTMSSSATKTRMTKTSSFSPTQAQEDLVVKFARLTEDNGDVKEQVMIPLAGEYSERMLHATGSQQYDSHIDYVPFDYQREQSEPAWQSPVPHVLHCPPDHLTQPSSPSLPGNNPSSQLGHVASFSALPPSAMGLSTPPKSSSYSAQETIFSQYPEQASVSLNYKSAAPSSPGQNFESLSTSSTVNNELPTLSTFKKSGHNRQARSIVNEKPSSKRLQETEEQPEQKIGAHVAKRDGNARPLLDSRDEARSSPTRCLGSIFSNSSGPLCELRNPTTLADEDVLALRASKRGAPTKSSRNLEHLHLDSDCDVSAGTADRDELPCKTFVANPLCESRSASTLPRRASTSSSCGSLSTSSDTEIIIERDPRAREVSRQEQAKSWVLHSRSDSNRISQAVPVNKEVRLSEDEKKAIDEAIQRSLEDLAESFDDIFLEDSSESNAGNDDL